MGAPLHSSSARPDGTLIWVRPLDSGTSRPVPGTERATRMFWSPDSRQIAFFVDGNLKKVALSGGPARLVANGPFRDGVWGPNGVILLGGQLGRPLFRVSEHGGEPIAVTALDYSLPEISHDYPEFLPGRRPLSVSRPWHRTAGGLGDLRGGARLDGAASSAGHPFGDAILGGRSGPAVSCAARRCWRNGSIPIGSSCRATRSR